MFYESSTLYKKTFYLAFPLPSSLRYGVHSPFAFSLITDVIYEKMPYYAYSSLKEEQKKMVRECGWTKGSQKVNRFLFRLVNRVQPDTIIEVGRPSSTALYLQSAKPSASYLFASDLSELFLDADTSVDFLYLNDYQNPDLLEEVFRVCVHRTTLKKCICSPWYLLFQRDESALEKVAG